VSLLLDALKRAEQEKLARQAERAAQAGAEASADRSVPVAKAGRLELETIEPARGPAPAAAAAAGERANAQAIFAAKETAARQSDKSRFPLYAAAALLVLLVVAGGAYVWLQVNAVSPRPYAQRPSQPASLKPATPNPPSAVPALMPPEAPVPPPASGVVPTNPAAPPVARVRPESLSPNSRRPAPPPAAAEKLVLDLLRETPAQASAPPLRLAKSMVPPRMHPEVGVGYEALRRGDLGQARRRTTRTAWTRCWGSPPSRRAPASARPPRACTARCSRSTRATPPPWAGSPPSPTSRAPTRSSPR
jgi:hypothetical protein